MIEVRDLRKNYGGVPAVDGVSFEIRPGEAFGLLGPNGAGKTTTILMTVGALPADSGQVVVDGQTDPTQAALRRSIGVAPQGLAIYGELTGEENLRFFGGVYGLAGAKLTERVDWALDFAGLTERRKQRSDKYSGGMQRRLNLACALVHEPKVLFCDEPTVGVDPQSRNYVFESIERLKGEGMTLIYTTHYMEEAQRLCDRVAILDQGKVLAIDTVAALIEEHGGSSTVEAELAVPPDPGHTLPGRVDGTHLTVDTERPFEVIADLGRANVEISQLRVERPNLERVFLNLTGRSLRD